jgi:hypothetical protein
MKLSCLCSRFGFVLGLLLLPALGRAVWEHAPIGPDTRLPGGRPAVWEYGMIYTVETLYPADFSCPAGAGVVIHFLNLSSKRVAINFEKPKRYEMVAPNAYIRLSLGTQAAGEHVFFLEFPDADNDHCKFFVPSRMRCVIRASTWPDTEFVFRGAMIARRQEVVPSELRIPAGRQCEIFFTGEHSASWQDSGYNFEIKPKAVTVTEFINPKGRIITGLFNSKSKLIIR